MTAGPGHGENPLYEYFEHGRHRLINKWMHYFDVYDRHLSRFRNTDVRLLEFGVYHGGSLQMWRDYLGPEATIVGVDIDIRCRDLGNLADATVVIADQEDREALRAMRARFDPFDVIIDDGGHTMNQQIVTFEEMYPHVRSDGVYIAEDLHTSYWPEFDGGFRNPGTFIERSKELIDQLNAWHCRDGSFEVDDFTRTTSSMHFYDSVAVFEKHRMQRPHSRMRGEPSFELNPLEHAIHAASNSQSRS